MQEWEHEPVEKLQGLKSSNFKPFQPNSFSRLYITAFVALFAVSGGILLLIGSRAATPQINSKKLINSDLVLVQTTTNQIRAIGAAVRDDRLRQNQVAPFLKSISQARQSALIKLVEAKPNQANQFILTDQELTDLSSVPENQLEQKVTLTGAYYVKSQTLKGVDSEVNSLITSSGEYQLYSNGIFPSVDFGSNVSISGYKIKNVIYIPGLSGSLLSIKINSPPPKNSSHIDSSKIINNATLAASQTNVVVIPVNFSNSPSSLSLTAIKAAFQGNPGHDINSYWSEASYNKENLNPTFLGPYTISIPTGSGLSCTNTEWQQFYNQFGSTIDFSQYSRIVLIKNCLGLSLAGSFPVPSVTSGFIFGGQIAQIPSDPINTSTIVHELSHVAGIGNYHSNFYNCQPQAFVPPTRSGPNCQSIAYGNKFDILGGGLGESGSSLIPHLDALHKRNAGWLGPTSNVTVNTPGTHNFKLLPYETPTSGVLTLYIPRGNSGTAFTLEYRQPIGFDSWMTSTNPNCGSKCQATKGPMLNFVYNDGTGDNQLIDTTPLSNQTGTVIDDEVDGMLLPSKSFTDPETGIVISTQSADSTGANVTVTIPTSANCTRNNPTIALTSPFSQTVAPKQTATYSYKITSNDSSNCTATNYRILPPASLFAYNNGVPDSFSDVASPDLVSIAPGASATVNLKLTSDNLVTDGAYSIAASQVVTNSLNTSPVNMPNVSYIVSTTTDTVAPSVPANVHASALGSKGANITWNAVIDNSGGSGLAGYKVLIDGSFMYSTAKTSLNLYTDLSPGNHSVTIRSYDHKDNTSAASTTINFSNLSSSDNQPPTSPGRLLVSSTDRNVSLSWGSSNDNTQVIGYFVIGPNQNIYVPANVTSASFSNLPTNTTYFIEVQAIDANGNFSLDNSAVVDNTAIVTTALAGTHPPTQPMFAYSPSANDKFIKLAWKPSSDDQTLVGYNIFRDGRQIATATTNSYTDLTVLAGKNYQYSVQAVDNVGNVSPITYFEHPLTTGFGGSDTTPPSTIKLVAPISGSTVNGRLNLSSSNVKDETQIGAVDYYLDGFFIGNSTNSPYNVSFDTTQTYNGLHQIEAIVKDSSDNYLSSGLTSFDINNSTLADNIPPTAPTGLKPYIVQSNQVVVYWGASADNFGVTGYNILRNGLRIATVSGSTLAFSDKTVTANTTYNSPGYTVRAFDAAGNVSALSNALAVTTPGP